MYINIIKMEKSEVKNTFLLDLFTIYGKNYKIKSVFGKRHVFSPSGVVFLNNLLGKQN